MRAEFKHNCLTFALVRFCRNCFGNNSYDKWVFTSLGLDILERNSSPELKRWIPRVTLKKQWILCRGNSQGVTTLVYRRWCSTEVRKIDPTWDSFEKSDPEWDWNFKIFSNFPTFFPNFPRCPTRDWFFYFAVFVTLPGTREGQKRYPATSGVSPYPLFLKYPRETPQLPLYGWYPLARFKRIKKFILQSVLFILIFLNQHTIDIGFSYMNKWTGGGFFVSSLMSLSRAHTIRSHQFVPSIKCKDPVSTKC